MCNLAGVLMSSGTVAFAVITLLPIELILKVSSGTGFAMVFALLIAAILWNLGTWWFGLPASSSHTMVGSIIGVGLASQLMNLHDKSSGLDWSQVTKVLEALLISPLLGFALAGILLLLSKRLLRYPALYKAPKGNEPPPWPIRALMVGTCTGVSYFHGSNDGQKGMGLIMLILIGTVPAAYALNHDTSPAEVQSFIAASAQAGQILDRHVQPGTPDPDARTEITDYIQSKQMQPGTLLALSQLVSELNREVSAYNSLPFRQSNKPAFATTCT
jgi:PiT family inorganic phosphate transporter